jgi:hypothetical protein
MSDLYTQLQADLANLEKERQTSLDAATLHDSDAANYTRLAVSSQQSAVDDRITAAQNQGAEDYIRTLLATMTPPADATVTVQAHVVGVNKLRLGVTHSEQTLLYGDATAMQAARSHLNGAALLHNTHVHSFGVGDPWPKNKDGSIPAEPTAWGTLDKQLLSMQACGGEQMITLYNLPSWMKGILQSDGTTRPVTDAFASDGRPYTEMIPKFLQLVQRVCERYMAPPWNVRRFSFWNEFKGLYRDHTLKGQLWAADDFPGAPGRADVGYTALYKAARAKVLEVAARLGIVDIQFGGPYVVMNSKQTPDVDSVASSHPLYGRPWGTPNKQGMYALCTFLDLAKAQGILPEFLTIDVACINEDGGAPSGSPCDSMASTEKMSDLVGWVQGELDKRSLSMDIWLAEWYAGHTANMALKLAVKAETIRKMALSGVSGALAWGLMGTGDGGLSLVTNPKQAGGGQSTLLLEVYRAFGQAFPPGCYLYDCQVDGSGVTALASDAAVLLINSDPASKAIDCDGQRITVAPGEVRFLPRV